MQRADAIIVLERGRIVEIGKHDELIGRPNGAYARLHQMQLLETARRRNSEQQGQTAEEEAPYDKSMTALLA